MKYFITTIAATSLMATTAFAAPIHKAAWNGDLASVQAELDIGADVNAKKPNGFTPLHYATAGGHKVIVELLIDKGADVNAKANDGKTPLDSAIELNATPKIADLLRKHGGMTSKELLMPRPRLSFTRSPFGFTFNTIEGRMYRVESGMDLKKWNKFKEFKGTGNEVKFIDMRRIWFQQHFYRVKVIE